MSASQPKQLLREVANTHNLSIWEVEAERSRIEVHPGLDSKFEATYVC